MFGSGGHQLNQITHLVLNVQFARNSLTDFVAHQTSVAASDAVDGQFNPTVWQVQLGGNLEVFAWHRLGVEKMSEYLKMALASRRRELRLQPRQGAFHNGQRPFAVEVSFRRYRGAGSRAGFQSGALFFPREQNEPATAFGRLLLFPFVNGKMLKAGQEKSAKPPARTIRSTQVTTLNEMGEESLGEVLRRVEVTPLSQGERKQRPPVILASMGATLFCRTNQPHCLEMNAGFPR